MAYSLWLTPPAGSPAAEWATARISALSARYAAPAFRPHVTLLGGFGDGLSQEEVERRSAALAASLSAPGQPCTRGAPCRVSHAEAGSIYYQCVYLRLHDDAPLHAAHAAARAAFAAHHKPPFMPHCSLLYSDIDAAERARVVAEVQPELQQQLLSGGGGEFAAEQLELWLTEGGDKSLASWRQLASYPLGGGGGA